jgi:hypothetical protein
MGLRRHLIGQRAIRVISAIYCIYGQVVSRGTVSSVHLAQAAKMTLVAASPSCLSLSGGAQGGLRAGDQAPKQFATFLRAGLSTQGRQGIIRIASKLPECLLPSGAAKWW